MRYIDGEGYAPHQVSFAFHRSPASRVPDAQISCLDLFIRCTGIQAQLSSARHLGEKQADLMYSNFREKAAGYVKEAVQADQWGDYPLAFEKYKVGLEYFSTHLKYEKDPRVKEAIYVKFKEYLERAEYLKSLLDGRQPPRNGAGPDQFSRPPGAGGSRAEGKEADSPLVCHVCGHALLHGTGESENDQKRSRQG